MTCSNCKFEFCWICEGPYNTAKFSEDGITIWGHDPDLCKKTLDKLTAKREKARKQQQQFNQIDSVSLEQADLELIEVYKKRFADKEKEAQFIEKTIDRK